MAKQIILSGMRPTGNLHIGNAVGALSNWLRLQSEAETECYYMVADWHALTTDYQESDSVESNIQEMVLDWLAAGLDPNKSTIFRQSWVHEHAELALILSMITPLSWLERNPTYKEQIRELKDKDITTHGFLGYPVLQAADILLYGATHVPVGEDQLPHLELAREIARRFNFIYEKQVFAEPQAILSLSPKVAGTDGRKMSKSYNNCIYLSDSETQLKKKIQSMYTDPLKMNANSLGHPSPCAENPPGCAVFALHPLYEKSQDDVKWRGKKCMEGALGCVPCKADLFQEMNASLQPHREKREKIAAQSKTVNQILLDGSKRAEGRAKNMLKIVREAIGFHEFV